MDLDQQQFILPEAVSHEPAPGTEVIEDGSFSYEGYEVVKSAEVAYGESYTTEMKEPENSGYGLAGYYLDAACTKGFTAEEFANKKIYRDTVIYVKWYTPEEMEEIKKGEEEKNPVLPTEE